ncbi:uncharacterized protein [Nicotiana tomentosiformis]|uniref:uncharacterized protein n=1 Tax=Nicotiana tomentosiformis TaxID=4098 RepID=UPI00388C6471
MNSTQINYTFIEKELLAIVFAIEKFCPYLMDAKVIVHTDHAALGYLMRKKDSKVRLMRWVFLLKESDIDIQYRKVFWKACHLSVELKNKAMWALKKLNLDWYVIANLRVANLNEFDEFRYHAYESSSLYKEKLKYLHDKYIWNKEFKVGDLLLLFNSRLGMFSRKLKSKWSGPFEIVSVTPFGALDLKNKNNELFESMVTE